MATAGAADPALVVSVLDSEEGFGALRSEWDALLERARGVSPFVSWDWQQGWWMCYGRGRRLRLYLARRGDRLVGVLPLYRHRVGVGLGLRCEQARFVGTGGDTSPDHLGALLDPEDEESVARHLVDAALGEPGWDVLWLSDVREGSTLATVLVAAARQRGLPTEAGPATPIGFVPLADGWEALLRRLGPKRRRSIGYERRRAARALGARFFVWQDPATLDQAFDRLATLHRLRWEGRGEHSFSSPEYLAFHREVMRRFLRRGWLRLFGLDVGGKSIAMLYCFRFRDEVYYFQGGFDPAYARFSPGFVLLGHALEHSTNEGAALFDMLKGEYEHKKLWPREARVTTHLRVYRRTLPGLLQRLRECELPTVTRLWRSVLRDQRNAG
jgi:CelD/BcsL family acetyltransferase involved in cellulose biosynthesis